MKVSLNLEESSSSDVSIIVDTLRASTTITAAFNNFKEVIPTFTPEQAKKIAKEKNGVLAGERTGKKIEGFELGNSPEEIKNYETKKETLVITTSNGTRIMENLNAKTILVGTFTNAKAVAKASVNLATEHIDVVMAGVKGNFAIEDYLGAGEILYWIEKELENKNKTKGNDKKYKTYKNKNTLYKNYKYKWELSEYAISAILASRDEKLVNEEILKSKSGRRLNYLGYKKDIEFCLKKNISENVAIYKNNKLKLYNLNNK